MSAFVKDNEGTISIYSCDGKTKVMMMTVIIILEWYTEGLLL